MNRSTIPMLAALLLAACDPQPARPAEGAAGAAGIVTIPVRSAGHDALLPVTMPDGTRCVVVQPGRPEAGRAIACDFASTRPHN